MNWEAAKTWLIIAFFLLDGILGWQVYQERQQSQQNYVEPYTDLLANTKTLLSEHGFSLNVSVPETHGKMSFLSGQFASPNLTDLATAVLPNTGGLTYDLTSGQAHANAGNIQISDRGTWKVSFTPPIATSKDGTGILKLVWHGTSYVPDDEEPVSASPVTTGNGSALQPVSGDKPTTKQYNFVEKYQSYPVFDADVEAQVGQGALYGYQQIAVVNLTPVGDPKPTISALDALDSLANSIDRTLDSSETQILSIELGYTHKVASSDLPPLSSSSDYWFPAWRVVTSSETYYINAYTGEVGTVNTSS